MAAPNLSGVEAGSVVNAEAREKTVKKSKRWTNLELLTLINYVKENGRVMFGSSEGHGVVQKKRAAWVAVAKEIKDVGEEGVDRGGQQGARNKWGDLKHRAKKYLKDRVGRNVTGGGSQPPTNEIFEAVLEALPSEITGGLAPFGELETLPIVPETLSSLAASSSQATGNPTHPSTSSSSLKRKSTSSNTEIMVFDTTESDTTHWKQSVMYLDEPVPVEQDARILGNIVLSPGQKHKRCLDVTLTYRVEDETDVTKIYYMGPEENS